MRVFPVLAELSAYERLCNRGKALGEDLRMKIIQDIIGKGEAFTTGFFMGSFSAILEISAILKICFLFVAVGKEFHQNV